jgi:hypothetical protein
MTGKAVLSITSIAAFIIVLDTLVVTVARTSKHDPTCIRTSVELDRERARHRHRCTDPACRDARRSASAADGCSGSAYSSSPPPHLWRCSRDRQTR